MVRFKSPSYSTLIVIFLFSTSSLSSLAIYIIYVARFALHFHLVYPFSSLNWSLRSVRLVHWFVLVFNSSLVTVFIYFILINFIFLFCQSHYTYRQNASTRKLQLQQGQEVVEIGKLQLVLGDKITKNYKIWIYFTRLNKIYKKLQGILQ